MQVAVGALTGLAAVMAGAAAGVLAPAIAPVIANAAVLLLGRRRIDNAAETLIEGASTAEMPLEDFLSTAVSDERRHELLGRALSIAQDAALRAKRLALGRALAAGIVADEAQLDEELLFVRAVADLDAPHLRMLSVLGASPGLTGLTLAEIHIADPGLGTGLLQLLAALELHGLIRVTQPGTLYVGPGAETARYRISDSGRRFLDRLADDT